MVLYFMTVSCRRNEELDDKAIIRQLKCRVAELENELAMLKRRYSVEQNV